MTGSKKAKPVVVAWLVLAWLVHAAADEPNYCHDLQVNQEWGRLIEEAPGDDILMRLFALRLGLCQLVDSGQLDLDRATEIFEQARSGALMERRRQEEQERGPDQRTGASEIIATPAYGRWRAESLSWSECAKRLDAKGVRAPGGGAWYRGHGRTNLSRHMAAMQHRYG